MTSKETACGGLYIRLCCLRMIDVRLLFSLLVTVVVMALRRQNTAHLHRCESASLDSFEQRSAACPAIAAIETSCFCPVCRVDLRVGTGCVVVSQLFVKTPCWSYSSHILVGFQLCFFPDRSSCLYILLNNVVFEFYSNVLQRYSIKFKVVKF